MEQIHWMYFQIIMGIEEEFDIEIPQEKAEKIVSVGDAAEAIKSCSWLRYYTKEAETALMRVYAGTQPLLFMTISQQADYRQN